MSMHPTRNYFLEYKTGSTFIETGSYKGDAIYLAVLAGFKKFISIEESMHLIKHCKERYHDLSELSIIQGDSAVVLEDAMKEVIEPATIWLDAHSQLFEDELASAHPFPLMYELEQIRCHPIKSHTILIDDVLMMTHPDVTGWTRRRLEAAVLQVNPSYKIEYLSNPVRSNILLART